MLDTPSDRSSDWLKATTFFSDLFTASFTSPGIESATDDDQPRSLASSVTTWPVS
jgi:hypothetical protein